MTSERAIQKGDLTMVVHRCCDSAASYGTIFCPQEIDERAKSICAHCGSVYRGRIALTGGQSVVNIKRSPFDWFRGKPDYEVRKNGYPCPWLKRIDPPALTEETTERTEQPA